MDAQPMHSFRNISHQHGLESTFVIDVFQDNKGIMWFCTTSGLVRYDGSHLKHYQNQLNDSLSLPSNLIRNVIQDKEGYFWIAGFGSGLIKFDPYKEVFQAYINPHSKSSNRIHRIVDDQKGHIWIASEGGGLHCFDKKSSKFSFHDPDLNDKEPLIRRQLRYMNIDSDGTLWIATRTKGLYSYQPTSKKWQYYSEESIDLAYQIKSNRLIHVYPHQNKIYVSGEENIAVIDQKSGKVLENIDVRKLCKDSIPPFLIFNLSIDHENKWWMGTNYGLIVYDTKSKSSHLYVNDPFVAGSISNNRILSMCMDKDNNIWIGTWQGGVNYTPVSGDRFQLIQHHPINKNSIINNYVQGLNFDKDGNIWAGSMDDGLSKIDFKNQKVYRFYEKKEGVKGLNSNKIWNIFKDKSGNIWTGGNPGGLHKIDVSINEISKIIVQTDTNKFLKDFSISSILQDSQNRFWLGSFNQRGLMCYLPEKNTIQLFRLYQKNDSSASSTNQIYDIVESFDKTLWISTNGAGLIHYFPATNEYEFYQADTKNEYGLKSNKIADILKDKNNYLWLCTVDGGLQCMDLRYPGYFETISKSDGMPSNTPMSIVQDDKGILWVAENGIIQLMPEISTVEKNGKFVPQIKRPVKLHVFNNEQAVFMNIFNEYGIFNSINKQVYFAGENGITYFNPEKIHRRKNVSQVLITDIRIFGKSYPSDTNIIYKNSLLLSYKDNFITFIFSATDYLNNGQQKFDYQLLGLDKDWVKSTGNEAVYTDLQPGNYVFRVKEQNADGYWSPVKELHITITPPFWKTIWFYCLCIISIGFLIYVIVKRRINNIKEKARSEKEKVELELKALRSQMNPHFLFNALTSIEKFILSNQSEKAASFLTDFAKLIRAILENSREEKVPLEKELNVLEKYIKLEQIRFKNMFQYTIDIQSDIDAYETEIPPMLIQPIVENAIIHGLSGRQDEHGFLKISISKLAESAIKICIEDNGSGRKIKSNPSNRSLGMSITNERLQQLNKSLKLKEDITVIDLKNESGEGIGTIVEMVIFVD